MTATCIQIVLGEDRIQVVRAWAALLTTRAHAGPSAQLVVVTDTPQRFAWFGQAITVIPVDQATVRSWHGPHAFHWRAKIEAIRLVRSRVQTHLVYMDTDVLVRKPLAELFAGLDQGRCFMHLREKDIAVSKKSGDVRLRKQLQAHIPQFALQPNPMWNAGVIAIPQSRLGLLDEVLARCDALLAAGCTHTLLEQLSFSQILDATGQLVPADAWITHYWNNKPGYDRAIQAFEIGMLQDQCDLEAATQRLLDHPIWCPEAAPRRRWWHRLLGVAPLEPVKR